jgi:anti-sigma-K factor RskA
MMRMLGSSIWRIVAAVATLAAAALATWLAATMTDQSPASAPAVVVLRADPTHLSQERSEEDARSPDQQLDISIKPRSTQR